MLINHVVTCPSELPILPGIHLKGGDRKAVSSYPVVMCYIPLMVLLFYELLRFDWTNQ